MRTRIRRSIFAILSAACMTTLALSGKEEVKAEVSWPNGPQIQAESAIVMDINTGAILYEKNPHEQLYPASITKILTSLIGIEECSLDEKVFFSKDAVYKNEGNTSHIAREWREELSVKSTLYAIMLESANECAYALAEHVAGKYEQDYEYFIQMMNSRAKELGCVDSNFSNANGLPDENHYTSAYDMALVSAEAYKNETFRILTGTKSYTIADSNRDRPDYNCYNHHLMMRKSSEYYCEYITGGKTGYTSAAGNTLVSYAEKDGMTLVCVVMKCPVVAYGDTRKILDYCFENFKVHNIEEKDERVIAQSLTGTGILNNNEPYVGFKDASYIILPASADFEDATFTQLEGDGKNIIAKFRYTYGDHVVGTINLVRTGARIENDYFSQDMNAEDPNIKVVKIRPIYIFVVVVALLLLIMVIRYIKLLADNFYIIKHDMETRRKNRERGKEARKSQKRRRRTNLKFK